MADGRATMMASRIGFRTTLALAALAAVFLLALGQVWAPPAVAAGSSADCARCHAKESADFPATAGKHKDMECGDCPHGHPPETAQPYPKCSDCHSPHVNSMTDADCSRCHRAHTPKTVTYQADVPSAWCLACHGQVKAALQAGSPKNAAIPCAVCHRRNHGATSACADCHGRLHPAAIMSRFPKCGECHHTAHELNHWPEPQPEIPAAEKLPG